MGRKCGVKDCQSDSIRPEDLGVTFHKIPAHPDVRSKWLHLCQIDEDKKLIYVCSRHFLRADFCNFKGKKYLLRQGVRPSIFAWNRNATKLKKEVTDVIKPTKEIEANEKSEVTNSGVLDSTTTTTTKESAELKSNKEKVDIKDEKIKNSTIIEQKIKTVNTATGELTFVPNTRIEALDFNQTWTPATILEVDYEENEVLVHFDNHTSKHDEWIGINSSSIRAITLPDEANDVKSIETKKNTEFEEGERCMASWSDSRKFPATVMKVIDNKTYEVLFDDGYMKVLKCHRMSKSSPSTPLSTPLFQPVEGSKEDRRTRKRKINVSSLFGKKRPKLDGPDIRSPSIELNEKSKPIEKEKSKDEPVKWFPSWENDLPVGINSDVLKDDGYSQSFIVPDPRLPKLWEKHIAQDKTTELWVSVIKAPDGTKFINKKEIRKYLKENAELYLSESLFDFAINKKEDYDIKLDNSLKIIQLPDGFQCPIEGCGKTFRRENLALMHVKHYHPKFSKFLESTPNVADLAYARTVGETFDKSPNSERPPKELKSSRGKAIKSTIEDELTSGNTNIINSTSEPKKDAEIIKLLNSTPFDLIKSTDSSTNDPLPSGLPPSMYPDIKLKDLLVKSESIPKDSEHYLKTLSTATVRPSGLKTLLPVRREKEETESSRRGPKRRHRISDNLEGQIQDHTITESTPAIVPEQQLGENNIIIEGGEVIKIVRMKQEEIINCTCGITEEDGLMIQCELCLCWQHAYCNNIQKENEVPEKYVCYICQHPVRQRTSKKFMHDQDWLKHGILPTGNYHCKDEDLQRKRHDKLKVSHDLSGGLLEIKDFMHTIRLKIKIAEVKNHPKLYLWSKPWQKQVLPEKVEIKTEGENAESNNMLLNLLKNKDETKIKEVSECPKLDINSLMENDINNIPASNIPQPEAAIETDDCRVNLLDHIMHCQNLVEERLNDFEQKINELDPSLMNDKDENYIRLRHTTSMLLRDLNTMKELSQMSTF